MSSGVLAMVKVKRGDVGEGCWSRLKSDQCEVKKRRQLIMVREGDDLRCRRLCVGPMYEML